MPSNSSWPVSPCQPPGNWSSNRFPFPTKRAAHIFVHGSFLLDILHKSPIVPERRRVRCAIVEGAVSKEPHCPSTALRTPRATPLRTIRFYIKSDNDLLMQDVYSLISNICSLFFYITRSLPPSTGTCAPVVLAKSGPHISAASSATSWLVTSTCRTLLVLYCSTVRP